MLLERSLQSPNQLNQATITATHRLVRLISGLKAPGETREMVFALRSLREYTNGDEETNSVCRQCIKARQRQKRLRNNGREHVAAKAAEENR